MDANSAEHLITPSVVYIVRSYPRLSQTFILNEILALERLGVRLEIVAMTNPHEPIVQPGVADVRAPTHYLEAWRQSGVRAAAFEHLRLALTSPRRYLHAAAYVLRRRDLDAGYSTASRFACLDAAVRLAARIRSDDARVAVDHVHSHFAHDPTLIALLLNRLTGIPFSFTAHARDLYQTSPRALADRIAAASAVVTCCRANLRYLERAAAPADRAKLKLIHHGVDLSVFGPADDAAPRNRMPRILSVGRLVEKKGFPDLVAACALLKRAGHPFRCEIYGDGPLYDQLVGLTMQLKVADRVTLGGGRPQHELADTFRTADIFVITPVVTGEGDRDGIPNVLVEAMACGLPVVSTPVGGIPEVVVHDETGLLAEPGDPASIAAQLATLLTDEERGRRLGARARHAVVDKFDTGANARALAAVLAEQVLLR
jgi:glycosyltransferase involved in cell wall biosynthesis